MRNESGKRAFVRVRTDVQLVEDAVLERYSLPRLVCPSERRGIYRLRSRMNSIGLNSRCRIRPRIDAVEAVQISSARLDCVNDCAKITRRAALDSVLTG